MTLLHNMHLFPNISTSLEGILISSIFETDHSRLSYFPVKSVFLRCHRQTFQNMDLITAKIPFFQEM